VRTPDSERLGPALDAAGLAYHLTDDGLAVDAPPEKVGQVAAAHRVVLHGLVGTAGLEQAFFRIIHDADADADAAQHAELRTPSAAELVS